MAPVKTTQATHYEVVLAVLSLQCHRLSKTGVREREGARRARVSESGLARGWCFGGQGQEPLVLPGVRESVSLSTIRPCAAV